MNIETYSIETHSKEKINLRHIITRDKNQTIKNLVVWVGTDSKKKKMLIMKPTANGSLEGTWNKIPKEIRKRKVEDIFKIIANNI